MDFYDCQSKTYNFPLTEGFIYVRLIQDESLPGCPRCIQINQIELYGTLVKSDSYFLNNIDENDHEESVSIIGKIRRV